MAATFPLLPQQQQQQEGRRREQDVSFNTSRVLPSYDDVAVLREDTGVMSTWRVVDTYSHTSSLSLSLPTTNVPSTTTITTTTHFIPVQRSWPPSDVVDVVDARYTLLSPFPPPPPPPIRTLRSFDGSVSDLAAGTTTPTSSSVSPPPRPLGMFMELPPLPPYVKDAEDPSPPYDRVNRNPDTLARHLFQLGFIFPLLWIINVIIILKPLQVYPADETDIDRCKTEEERREELDIMREVELRWARRSALALAVFLSLVLVVVLVLVLGRRGG